MLIFVSSFSAPSGISIDASPSTTFPPSLADISTSDFSSLTGTAVPGFASAGTASATNWNGVSTLTYAASMTAAATLFPKPASCVLTEFLSIFLSPDFLFLKYYFH